MMESEGRAVWIWYWENLQSKGWEPCSFAWQFLPAAGFQGFRIWVAVIRADSRDMGAVFGSITQRKSKFLYWSFPSFRKQPATFCSVCNTGNSFFLELLDLVETWH